MKKQSVKILLLIAAICFASLTLAEEEEDDGPDECDALWDGFDESDQGSDVTKAATESSTDGGTDEGQGDQEETSKEKTTDADDESEDTTEENAETSDGAEEESSAEDTEAPKESGGESPTGAPGKDEEHPKESEQDSDSTIRDRFKEFQPDIDEIKDEYLKNSLDNRLQEHLRVPIIVLIQSKNLYDFSKIEKCFENMNKEVKSNVDASKTRFNTCKEAGSDSHKCMVENEPQFSSAISQMVSTMKDCMLKGA